MRPTRVRALLALLLGVAAVAWGVVEIAVNRGVTLPVLTWFAPVELGLLGVAVLVTALGLRSRLRRPARRPHPLSMVRLAALGKASANAGPVIGGLYLGYLAFLLPHLDIGDRRHRALICLVALLASVLLSVAGLLLERQCRVRSGPGSDLDDVPASGV